MKKIFLLLLVGFFAVVVAACSNLPTLESISLSGQDVEFYVGEEFDASDLVVTAKLSDASVEDVTTQAVVSHEADMNKAGKYTVTVTYKGLTETYEITVIDDTLVSLTIENVETEYNIGDEVSFEGATAKETWKSGKVIDADLDTYDVVIKDEAGKEYTGAFAKVGKNTVKVSKGAVVCEFEVNVAANLYASIADAIDAAFNNADKVASGSAIIDQDGYINNYIYAFGENFTTYTDPDNTVYYYELLEDGNVFGVQKYYDSWEEKDIITPAYEPSLENLNGANFSSVVGYYSTVYGAEVLLDTLLLMGQAEGINNFNEVVPTEASGVYGFSYDGMIEGSYYFVNVEFKLDVNTDAVSEIKVEMKGYYSILNEETWEYEAPTEFAETPDFSRNTLVNQVIGERVEENPYKYADVVINSLELQDENGNASPLEYNVKAGETITLKMVNILPTTAVLSINTVSYEYENNDWTLYVDAYQDTITLTPNGVREYVVVLSCGNASFEIKITATEPTVESLTTLVGQYFENFWGGGYELVEGNTATVEVGQKLYLGAEIYPLKANQEVTYEFKEATENATIALSDFSDWDAPYNSLTFTASLAGTYVVVLTSVANPSISGEITVTVTESTKEPVTLDGKWLAEFTNPRTGMTYDFELVLNLDGTGTLNCYNSEFAEFTYAFDGNSIVYTITNDWQGDMADCSVDLTKGAMMLTITTEDWGYYPLEFEKEVEEESDATLVGDWEGTYPHHMNPMLPCNVTMTFNADGTGSGVFNGTALTFEYTDNGDSVSFTEVSSEDITFTIGTYTDGYAELTVFIFVAGTSVQATLTK